MKVKHILEARARPRSLPVVECYTLTYVSGGRGGPEDAEFGYREDVDEVLPDHVYYNLVHNNTFGVLLPNERHELNHDADEFLGWAHEDIEEGADIL